MTKEQIKRLYDSFDITYQVAMEKLMALHDMTDVDANKFLKGTRK